jgi:quinol monooxygenase YgiN
MFEATARLTIRDGVLDGFKHQVDEIMALTKEKDTKPLRYDWFLSDDGTECEVGEVYVDADSLLDQQRYLAEAKMKLFRGFTAGHTMTFYAEPSPALAGALNAMGADFTQFSFFQGLGAETNPLSATSETFGVLARLGVREGELDGFKRQVAEIMRQTKEKDTKTLRYDWFLTGDGTKCEVREAYVDADGLVEHHHHIAEAKIKLFRDFADDHNMTFYAEPSPALAEATKAIPGVTITQFSLFQGLEADSRVLEEVPA